MRQEYALVSMKNINMVNLVTNRDEDLNKILSLSNLPEEYQKFVMFFNKSWTAGYGQIALGDTHNSKFFELLTNHPFNMGGNRYSPTFYSATFGSYLTVTTKEKFKKMSKEDVIVFYKMLQDKGLLEDYVNLLYSLFTDAFGKSYPPVPKEIDTFRKIRAK